MRKLLLILAISAAIAILYGADTHAEPEDFGGGLVLPTEPFLLTVRPNDAGHDR